MSRGAFYSNFGDKETLFFPLFDRYADREVERLEQALGRGGSVDDLVATIATTRGRDEARIAAQWFVLSTEFTIHAIRNPEHRAVLAEHDRQLRQRIAAALQSQLSQREQAGIDHVIDPDLLARLVVAVHEGGMMQSLVEPDAVPEGSLTQEFLARLLAAPTRP